MHPEPRGATPTAMLAIRPPLGRRVRESGEVDLLRGAFIWDADGRVSCVFELSL